MTFPWTAHWSILCRSKYMTLPPPESLSGVCWSTPLMNSWATARGGHVLSSRSRCRASTPMMQRVPALVAPPPRAHINIANKVGTQSPNNLAVVLRSGRTTGRQRSPSATLKLCDGAASFRGAHHGDFCRRSARTPPVEALTGTSALAVVIRSGALVPSPEFLCPVPVRPVDSTHTSRLQQL